MIAIRSGIPPSVLLKEDPLFIDTMLLLLQEEQEEAEEAKRSRK